MPGRVLTARAIERAFARPSARLFANAAAHDARIANRSHCMRETDRPFMLHTRSASVASMTPAPQAEAQLGEAARRIGARPFRIAFIFARVPPGRGAGNEPADASGTAVGRALSERVMGRFLLFIIIIVAALAGVWFYMPGGKDMLTGVKDKAMSFVPNGAAGDEAAPAEEVVIEEVIVEEAPAEEPAAEEAPAEEPQD